MLRIANLFEIYQTFAFASIYFLEKKHLVLPFINFELKKAKLS